MLVSEEPGYDESREKVIAAYEAAGFERWQDTKVWWR